MRHQIDHAPTFTTIEFEMAAGESVTVQPGCMLGMTTGFDLKSGLGSHVKGRRGLGRALRSSLAGESFLAAIYTAKRDNERLLLAPSEQGDIRALEVRPGAQRYIAPGAFLRSCTARLPAPSNTTKAGTNGSAITTRTA